MLCVGKARTRMATGRGRGKEISSGHEEALSSPRKKYFKIQHRIIFLLSGTRNKRASFPMFASHVYDCSPLWPKRSGLFGKATSHGSLTDWKCPKDRD